MGLVVGVGLEGYSTVTTDRLPQLEAGSVCVGGTTGFNPCAMGNTEPLEPIVNWPLLLFCWSCVTLDMEFYKRPHRGTLSVGHREEPALFTSLSELGLPLPKTLKAFRWVYSDGLPILVECYSLDAVSKPSPRAHMGKGPPRSIFFQSFVTWGSGSHNVVSSVYHIWTVL